MTQRENVLEQTLTSDLLMNPKGRDVFIQSLRVGNFHEVGLSKRDATVSYSCIVVCNNRNASQE